jgi:phosphatidylglycerol:prolipoprotein diacylglycerol transferase
MHPSIGLVPSYPIALALAVVVSALVGASGLRRSGLSIGDCLRVQCALALTGLLGAKLNSLIERGGTLLPLHHELIHGYRYPGAVLALIVVLLLWGRHLSRRVSFVAIGDAIAPSIGVGAAILRLGCFLHGCCFGVLSTLPWAVTFPAHSPPWHAHVGASWIGPASIESLPVHPLQLYFACVSLTAALCARWLQSRKRCDGEPLLVFLAIDGLGKFGLEYLRSESAPAIQTASLALGLAAVLGIVLVHSRSTWAERPLRSVP